MTRIFSHEDDCGKLKPGRAVRGLFEWAADPHFNHRASPREVQIGVVQRTGVQPRSIGGRMNRICVNSRPISTRSYSVETSPWLIANNASSSRLETPVLSKMFRR